MNQIYLLSRWPSDPLVAFSTADGEWRKPQTCFQCREPLHSLHWSAWALIHKLYRATSTGFPVTDGSESHPTDASIIHWDPGSCGIVGDINYILGYRDKSRLSGEKMRSLLTSWSSNIYVRTPSGCGTHRHENKAKKWDSATPTCYPQLPTCVI
jgi:hypothetical protein